MVGSSEHGSASQTGNFKFFIPLLGRLNNSRSHCGDTFLLLADLTSGNSNSALGSGAVVTFHSFDKVLPRATLSSDICTTTQPWLGLFFGFEPRILDL
jgi:hypothetical protein